MRSERKALAVVIALRLSVSAASALAAGPPSKDECIDANKSAQTLRRSGKLHAARTALHVCANEHCPGPVSDDCTSRLDEVERAMPSLVFEVRDGAGHDLTKVKVSMDGETFAEALDGTPLAADPGAHTFVFEIEAQPPVTEKLVLREGEKGRHVRVVIGEPAPTPAAGPFLSAPGPARSEAAPPGRNGMRVAGIAVGAAGIVSLGLGGVFGGLASASWSSSQNACATPTSCPNHAQAVSDYNTASSEALVSTIGFIAGGVLVAGGLVLVFTAPPRAKDAAPRATLQLAPTLARGAAGLNLRATF
jgi:hypothetical protein